jgi:hypothetical protein
MADVHKFSEQVIDLAERVADVADAASGKGVRKGGAGRWLLLPAAGAGLYALATSGSFTRQAKGVVNQAKARASDLPDDLMGLVRQQSQTPSRRRTSSSQSSGNGSKRRRTGSSASRKTTSSTR